MKVIYLHEKNLESIICKNYPQITKAKIFRIFKEKESKMLPVECPHPGSTYC